MPEIIIVSVTDARKKQNEKQKLPFCRLVIGTVMAGIVKNRRDLIPRQDVRFWVVFV